MVTKADILPTLIRVTDQRSLSLASSHTSDEDDPASMARFIHQAWVRRAVVIKLIEGACRRQHRAYAGIVMDRVRKKAQCLPEI